MAQSAWVQRYGRWAIVTGASSGIGRACALEAARRGLDVVIVARREDELRRLAAEIAAIGRASRIMAADLADPDAVAGVMADIADLDIGLLVAAAGFGTAGDFLAIDTRQELEMIDVNCRAVFQLVRGLAPRMAARRRGGIVLFGSIVAFQGVARAANYAATKAYAQVLAEGLHRELKPLGIDVLASAPGPVNTGFAARSDLQMGAATSAETVARATLNALGKRAIVRPGLLSKLLIYGLATAPRALRGRIMSSIMQGMTRHHAPRDPEGQAHTPG